MKLDGTGRIKYVFFRILNAVYRRWEVLVHKARYASHYPQFRSVGTDVVWDRGVEINEPENITIGDHTFIGQNVHLNAVGPIHIGDHVAIAAGCRIMTWNHRIDNREIAIEHTGKESAPVRIGDGVWLGYDTIVLPGVTIGRGAVVAAGAVVTDDVGPFEIVAGTPARKVGEREEESDDEG